MWSLYTRIFRKKLTHLIETANDKTAKTGHHFNIAAPSFTSLGVKINDTFQTNRAHLNS